MAHIKSDSRFFFLLTRIERILSWISDFFFLRITPQLTSDLQNTPLVQGEFTGQKVSN